MQQQQENTLEIHPEKLGDATFMRSFSDKGRFRRLMESMPVKVILNDRAALVGAARHAVMAED